MHEIFAISSGLKGFLNLYIFRKIQIELEFVRGVQITYPHDNGL